MCVVVSLSVQAGRCVGGDRRDMSVMWHGDKMHAMQGADEIAESVLLKKKQTKKKTRV